MTVDLYVYRVGSCEFFIALLRRSVYRKGAVDSAQIIKKNSSSGAQGGSALGHRAWSSAPSAKRCCKR